MPLHGQDVVTGQRDEVNGQKYKVAGQKGKVVKIVTFTQNRGTEHSCSFFVSLSNSYAFLIT